MESNVLPQSLHVYFKKFAAVRYNRYHLAKSLCYFQDADSEPDLEFIAPLKWEEIKLFFLNSAKHLEEWALSK